MKISRNKPFCWLLVLVGVVLTNAHATAGHDASWFTEFRNRAGIDAKTGAMLEASALVSVYTIGLSTEGRPISALRVHSAGGSKPAFLFTGAQHGSEWLSSMMVMWIADQVVQLRESAVAGA